MLISSGMDWRYDARKVRRAVVSSAWVGGGWGVGSRGWDRDRIRWPNCVTSAGVESRGREVTGVAMR